MRVRVYSFSDIKELAKSQGHKYKSRKRVGDRWVYEYDDKPAAGVPSKLEPHPPKAIGAAPGSYYVKDLGDGRVRVSQHKDSDYGPVMPKASLRHFYNDLSGKVDVPPGAPHPAIDKVSSGEAELLGKGDDGIAFKVGNLVVKVSTTVPYQPMNPGHRSPKKAAEKRRKIAKVLHEGSTLDKVMKDIENDEAIALMEIEWAAEDVAKKALPRFYTLRKAPFIGPKGGLYEDPQHKRPWKRGKKPSHCPRCKGVAHIISRQITIGGDDVVSSAPCRTCNPKGKIPLDPKKVKAAGLPMPAPAKRRKEAPPEREQPATPKQLAMELKRPRQLSLVRSYAVEAYPLGGYLETQGLRIAIENDKGSKRRWYDPETREHGETVMVHDYGFIIGYEGADGDEIDVYVGPNLDSEKVFVVNQRQMKDKRKFDEHKVMLGFDSEEEARAAYLKHYDKHGPQMLGSCVVWTMERFKRWLEKRGAPKGPVRKALRLMVPL